MIDGTAALWLFRILLAILAIPTASAVEIEHLEIEAYESRYEIDMSFRVAAPAANVIAVLTDFGYPDRLNPDVTDKKVIAEQDGVTRVRIEFEGCALFFCRATAMTQDVTVVGNEIRANTIPDGGDFESGQLLWRVLDDPYGARIEFRATIRHRSFILPFIGNFFVRKRLRQQLLSTAENLEIEASR